MSMTLGGIVVNNLSEGESIEIGLIEANLEDSQYENDLDLAVTFMKNALRFFRIDL